MASSSYPDGKKKIVVRQAGLADALWACVLDDYLSEEEEGEISKVIGYTEKTPWYLNPDEVTCTGSKPIKRRGIQDPRDAKQRGGRIYDSSDEERDGTPGVWDDDVSSTNDLPPVMWLSVPPTEDSTAVIDSEWDVGSTDGDGGAGAGAGCVSVPSSRGRSGYNTDKRGMRSVVEKSSSYHEAVKLAKERSRPSRPSSRMSSRSPSRLSHRSPMTMSRGSSDKLSIRDTKSFRSRGRSKSQTRYSRGHRNNDDLESRQTKQSQRSRSQVRRQSIGRPPSRGARSRTGSPTRELKRKPSSRDNASTTRSTSTKDYHSLKRAPSQGLRARLREALAG